MSCLLAPAMLMQISLLYNSLYSSRSDEGPITMYVIDVAVYCKEERQDHRRGAISLTDTRIRQIPNVQFHTDLMGRRERPLSTLTEAAAFESVLGRPASGRFHLAR